MQDVNIISVDVFCETYQIESEVVNHWRQKGLLEFVEYENRTFLPFDQLHKAEQLIRLHVELGIQPEDADVVLYLIEKVEQLQKENNSLKSLLDI